MPDPEHDGPDRRAGLGEVDRGDEPATIAKRSRVLDENGVGEALPSVKVGCTP